MTAINLQLQGHKASYRPSPQVRHVSGLRVEAGDVCVGLQDLVEAQAGLVLRQAPAQAPQLPQLTLRRINACTTSRHTLTSCPVDVSIKQGQEHSINATKAFTGSIYSQCIPAAPAHDPATKNGLQLLSSCIRCLQWLSM